MPAAVLATALSLTVGAVAPSTAHDPATADTRTSRQASLSMSPTSGYLPGSDLTLTGNLGVSGRHRVVVQRHLGRDGDRWTDIAGSGATTRRSGAFVVHVPASGMNDIAYRVASATTSHATPSVAVDAAIQETVVTAQERVVAPGAPLTLTVDTTVGSGSFAAAPPLAGRGLTLQQRVGGFRWATIATGATDAQGNGSFTIAAPTAVGEAVYRVRQEDWTAGLDRARLARLPPGLRHGGRPLRAYLPATRGSDRTCDAPVGGPGPSGAGRAGDRGSHLPVA